MCEYMTLVHLKYCFDMVYVEPISALNEQT